MLASDQRIRVGEYDIFQDYSDKNLYYYLPSDAVTIADEGKALQFVVYQEGGVKAGSPPDFSAGIDKCGGFLTLEVELGPTEEEIKRILEELKESNPDAKLIQVPFKDGDVKLVMFAENSAKPDIAGGEASKPVSAVDLHFDGSTKPSLFGRQRAVFSVRLGGLEAEVIYNLLKGTTQTQLAVVYDLQFLGIMPAYHLKITVDFTAAEDYWDHHFYLDADVKGKKGDIAFAVAADVDVDYMIRELVDNGDITIEYTDFTEDHQAGPLPSTDQDAMGLIKKLVGAELFTPTAIPNAEYKALETAANTITKKGTEDDQKRQDDGEKAESSTAQGEKEEQKVKGTDTASDNNDNNDPSPEAVSIDIDAKIGYTLKRRDISEKKKRTYIFDQDQAQLFKYNPSGILTSSGELDANQLTYVALGEGPFKTVKIQITSNVDFDAFGINEIVLECLHSYKDDMERDITLAVPVNLNKEHPKEEIYFKSSHFYDSGNGLTYTTKFLFKDGKVLGGTGMLTELVNESKDSPTHNLAITINPNDVEKATPIAIQVGNLRFTDKEYVGASLELYDKDVHLLKVIPFTADTGLQHFYLVNDAAPYTVKKKFFLGDTFKDVPCVFLEDDGEICITEKMTEPANIVMSKPKKGLVKLGVQKGAKAFSETLIGLIVTLKKEGDDDSSIEVFLDADTPEYYLVFNCDQETPDSYNVSVVKEECDKTGKIKATAIENSDMKITSQSPDITIRTSYL